MNSNVKENIDKFAIEKGATVRAVIRTEQKTKNTNTSDSGIYSIHYFDENQKEILSVIPSMMEENIKTIDEDTPGITIFNKRIWGVEQLQRLSDHKPIKGEFTEVIPDDDIGMVWKDVGGGYKVCVGPDFYSDMGIPIDENGEEMKYLRTTLSIAAAYKIIGQTPPSDIGGEKWIDLDDADIRLVFKNPDNPFENVFVAMDQILDGGIPINENGDDYIYTGTMLNKSNVKNKILEKAYIQIPSSLSDSKENLKKELMSTIEKTIDFGGNTREACEDVFFDHGMEFDEELYDEANFEVSSSYGKMKQKY